MTKRLDDWVATGNETLKGEAAKLFDEYEKDRIASDDVEEKAEAEAAAALDAEREAQRADIDELKEQLDALNQKLENRLREPEELVKMVVKLKEELAADEKDAYAAYEEFRLADRKLAEVDGDLLKKLQKLRVDAGQSIARRADDIKAGDDAVLKKLEGDIEELKKELGIQTETFEENPGEKPAYSGML